MILDLKRVGHPPVGAFWVTSRPGSHPAEAGELPAGVSPRSPARESGSPLLDALKEELFQLEMDHHQGKLTQAEYDQARAALDVTMKRAASRQKS